MPGDHITALPVPVSARLPQLPATAHFPYRYRRHTPHIPNTRRARNTRRRTPYRTLVPATIAILSPHYAVPGYPPSPPFTTLLRNIACNMTDMCALLFIGWHSVLPPVCHPDYSWFS